MTITAVFRHPDRTPMQRIGSAAGYALAVILAVVAGYAAVRHVNPTAPWWPLYALAAVAAVLTGISLGCWIATRDRRYPS